MFSIVSKEFLEILLAKLQEHCITVSNCVTENNTILFDVDDSSKAKVIIDDNRIVINYNYGHQSVMYYFKDTIRNYDEVKNYCDIAEFCADTIIYVLKLYLNDNIMELCTYYNYLTLYTFIKMLCESLEYNPRVVFNSSDNELKVVSVKINNNTFIFKVKKKRRKNYIGASTLQVKIGTLVSSLGSFDFLLYDMSYQDIEKLVNKLKRLIALSKKKRLTDKSVSKAFGDGKSNKVKSSSSDSTELRLITLKYNNKIVGYRFEVDDKESYDISLAVAKQHGVVSSKVSESMELQEHNGLFLSKKEIDSGNIVTEISNDKILVDKLFKAYKER